MAQMYIPGMTLGYREWGVTHAESAPAAICLHDLGQNGHIWRTLAQHLSEVGCRSFALDLPAHGESGPCPWGYSLPALRPVLEAFRAGMGLGNPIWVASGFSTKVLLDYAAHYPEQVRGMVLIEPVDPGTPPTWRRLPAYWAMRRWLRAAGPFSQAAEMFAAGRMERPYCAAWDAPASGWPEPGRHPVAHAFFATMQHGPEGDWRARVPPEVYRRYLEALLASDVLPGLPQVRAPTLLAKRSGTKGDSCLRIAEAVARSEAVVFERDEEPSVRPGQFWMQLRRWMEAGLAAPAQTGPERRREVPAG